MMEHRKVSKWVFWFTRGTQTYCLTNAVPFIRLVSWAFMLTQVTVICYTYYHIGMIKQSVETCLHEGITEELAVSGRANVSDPASGQSQDSTF